MISPTDLFSLAEELSEPENNKEVKYRSSISRAYYSAYHETRCKVIKLTQCDSSENFLTNHQAFIHKLTHESQFSLFKKIGNNLYDLKENRNKADYKLDAEVTRSTTKKSLSLAKRIITACNAL